jgi:hypothetical protein
MISLQLALARILFVPRLVAWYIGKQREKFRPQAVPLSDRQKAAMAGFFPAELLEAARVVVLDGARVPNPPFRGMFARLGFADLPDMSHVTAITFGNVVVSHTPFTDALLFHELVHVEQYRQLGIRRFSELYVRGFLLGGGYHGIPLEVNAYALGRRFESNQRFYVSGEVAKWVREDRFRWRSRGCDSL